MHNRGKGTKNTIHAAQIKQCRRKAAALEDDIRALRERLAKITTGLGNLYHHTIIFYDVGNISYQRLDRLIPENSKLNSALGAADVLKSHIRDTWTPNTQSQINEIRRLGEQEVEQLEDRIRSMENEKSSLHYQIMVLNNRILAS
ncbi:MAG: hypothetical protein LBP24_03600 [Coriobacteriales bacterium]|jgi:polyhydroxyalkanoate synthesis regulator phasin|nr:hypothetical protein [Coriobacteriales bacterium]